MSDESNYQRNRTSSDDDLRDRIAAALYCHRHPREPMWGALRMARGEGMDTERGQTNCVQRIYVPMAQAIIDEFGLHAYEFTPFNGPTRTYVHGAIKEEP